MICFDPRWSGPHGIGRFSAAVLGRITGEPLRIRGNPASALDSLVLAKALASYAKGSVFFSPGYNSPLFSRIPFVFTVHDLNHIDREENSNLAKKLYYATLLKSACRRAYCVLTVSDYSRNRILEWSGVPSGHVVNVGNGVDSAFHPGVQPFEPGYPYLFCVGNRKLHKNESRVVKAFALAKTPREVKLMFSGSATAELIEQIEKARITDRVIFSGLIPEAQLPSYYRGALGLLFPSLYEGFGLPVVEAMACGTPVITSASTALREIGQGAALLVDPESEEEIAQAIVSLLDSAQLREQLRLNGLQRAAGYTWERTADKVRRVLRGAVTGEEPDA